MTRYLLDADVLIRAKNQHYGFDICPGYWRWLDNEHSTLKVSSVERVYEELVAGGDQLSEWATQRRGFFLNRDHGLQASETKVSEWANANFRPSVANAFMRKADYGLVAHAHASGCTVVTYEVSAPRSNKSIKIPDSCKAMGVKCTSPHEMLRQEKVRFVLST